MLVGRRLHCYSRFDEGAAGLPGRWLSAVARAYARSVGWFFGCLAVILLVTIVRQVLLDVRLSARLRRSAAAVPAATWDAVFASIDRTGAEDPDPVVILRPAGRGGSDSWLGGSPDLPAGLGPPVDGAGRSARFALQLRLRAPPLPRVWDGRRVFVFVDEQWNVIVLGTNAPPSAGVTSTGAGGKHIAALRLPRVAVQRAEDRDILPPWDPAVFFPGVPAGMQLLSGYGEDPVRLLITRLHVWGILDDPELTYDGMDCRCVECSAPMRLLFRFELGQLEGLEYREDSLLRVHGCDLHPERLEARLDKRNIDPF